MHTQALVKKYLERYSEFVNGRGFSKPEVKTELLRMLGLCLTPDDLEDDDDVLYDIQYENQCLELLGLCNEYAQMLSTCVSAGALDPLIELNGKMIQCARGIVTYLRREQFTSLLRLRVEDEIDEDDKQV